MVGFSAVGSLREEVKPRDFCVGGGVVDWTKGVRDSFSSPFLLLVLREREGERKGRELRVEADLGYRFDRGRSSKREW